MNIKMVGIVAVAVAVAACAADKKPAPGPTNYCIVEGHALRQAIGPDPKPSDPHDVPRRPCTPEDLREARPKPTPASVAALLEPEQSAAPPAPVAPVAPVAVASSAPPSPSLPPAATPPPIPATPQPTPPPNPQTFVRVTVEGAPALNCGSPIDCEASYAYAMTTFHVGERLPYTRVLTDVRGKQFYILGPWTPVGLLPIEDAILA